MDNKTFEYTTSPRQVHTCSKCVQETIIASWFFDEDNANHHDWCKYKDNSADTSFILFHNYDFHNYTDRDGKDLKFNSELCCANCFMIVAIFFSTTTAKLVTYEGLEKICIECRCPHYRDDDLESHGCTQLIINPELSILFNLEDKRI